MKKFQSEKKKLRELIMKNRGSQKSKSSHSRPRSPSPDPDETWDARLWRYFGY